MMESKYMLESEIVLYISGIQLLVRIQIEKYQTYIL
jgi:hypothetical protein